MSEKNKNSDAYLRLPPKRQRFVDEYVIDSNGTQAAIRAGYSPKTAGVQAESLLKIPDIREALDEKLAEIRKKNELTVDYVIDRAKKIIERCMQAEPVYDRIGDPTGEYKFDAAGANGSLKILAKYLGMETTKHEITGKDGEAINIRYDYSKLSADELRQLLALTDKVVKKK